MTIDGNVFLVSDGEEEAPAGQAPWPAQAAGAAGGGGGRGACAYCLAGLPAWERWYCASCCSGVAAPWFACQECVRGKAALGGGFAGLGAEQRASKVGCVARPAQGRQRSRRTWRKLCLRQRGAASEGRLRTVQSCSAVSAALREGNTVPAAGEHYPRCCRRCCRCRRRHRGSAWRVTAPSPALMPPTALSQWCLGCLGCWAATSGAAGLRCACCELVPRTCSSNVLLFPPLPRHSAQPPAWVSPTSSRLIKSWAPQRGGGHTKFASAYAAGWCWSRARPLARPSALSGSCRTTAQQVQGGLGIHWPVLPCTALRCPALLCHMLGLEIWRLGCPGQARKQPAVSRAQRLSFPLAPSQLAALPAHRQGTLGVPVGRWG